MIILNPCLEDFEVLEQTGATVSCIYEQPNGVICVYLGPVTTQSNDIISINEAFACFNRIKSIDVDGPTCRSVRELSDDGFPGYTEQMIERLRGREDVLIDHTGLTGERSTAVTLLSHAAVKAYIQALKLTSPAPAPTESEATPGRIYTPTIEKLRELASEKGKRFNLSAKNLYGVTHLHEAVTIGIRTNLSGSVVAFGYYDESHELSVCPAEWVEWIEPTSNPVVLIEPQNTEVPCPCPSSKVKSDGGSSDYYKLSIKRASDGAVFECETGDIIAALVGDNFTLGNCVKALRRMWCDSKGQGKEGIDMQYDTNKVKYFVDDFVKRYGKGK